MCCLVSAAAIPPDAEAWRWPIYPYINLGALIIAYIRVPFKGVHKDYCKGYYGGLVWGPK